MVAKFLEMMALKRVGYVAPALDCFEVECFGIIASELETQRRKKNGGKDAG